MEKKIRIEGNAEDPKVQKRMNENLIGRTFTANWLWIQGLGRLYNKQYTIEDVTPKGFVKIALPIEEKIYRFRTKIKDNFIDFKNDEIEMQDFIVIG